MLDTTRSVETPEGVELTLRLAGPAPRALAACIDLGLRITCYLVLLTLVPLLGDLGVGLFFLAVFAGEWLYPVYFEVRRQGATPGKRALGLAVVHDDGTAVRWPAALVRNLLRFVDLLPLGYGFGLLAMLGSERWQRLGDLAAGTLVVHRERGASVARIPQVRPEPPPLALRPDEQQAIAAYAARLEGWSPARAVELAERVPALTGGARGDEAVRRLVGIAAWLLGRR